MHVFTCPAPFCIQLYQDILHSSNGIVKWTFLKPLMHGKILYTPDVPEAMEIINKVSSFVFNILFISSLHISLLVSCVIM